MIVFLVKFSKQVSKIINNVTMDKFSWRQCEKTARQKKSEWPHNYTSRARVLLLNIALHKIAAVTFNSNCLQKHFSYHRLRFSIVMGWLQLHKMNIQ